MSQIDQAFLKAYAKERSRNKSTTSEIKHPINIASSNPAANVFAHAPSPMPAPHAVSRVAPPTSPSLDAPTLANPARATSTIHTTMGTTRQRSSSTGSSSTVRIDQAETRPMAHQAAAHQAVAQQAMDLPFATRANSGEDAHALSSLQTTRKTLSSYFQESRIGMGTAQASIIPEAKSPNSPIPNSPIPSIATRWSQSQPELAFPSSTYPAESAHPDQAFNESVDRGADFNAWQFHMVERGVKSNSTSDGPSAKIRNPGKPNSFLRIDQSHRDPRQDEDYSAPVQAAPAPMPKRPAQPMPKPYVSSPAAVSSPVKAGAEQSNPFTRPLVYQDYSNESPIGQASAPVVAIKPPVVLTPQPQTASAKVTTAKPLAEKAAKLSVPVQPTWEVDEFLWPTTIAGLFDNQPDAIRDIGLHLQHAASKGLRTLAVTSGERGVGRSTVAMCIAKAVSRTGLRVAIVDCDFECPSLVDQLNLEVAHGWPECILDNVPLDEVAVHSVSEAITFFPLLAAWSISQVQMHQLRVNKLLKRIALGYDLVVLDSNRINGKQQTLLGLGEEPVIDAALVIVDAQLSLRQRVDGAIETLRRNNIHSIGLAENFHSQG